MGVIEEEKSVSQLKEKFERLATEQRYHRSYRGLEGNEKCVKSSPIYFRSYRSSIRSPVEEKLTYERSYIRVPSIERKPKIRSFSCSVNASKAPCHVRDISSDLDVAIPDTFYDLADADTQPLRPSMKRAKGAFSDHKNLFSDYYDADDSSFKDNIFDEEPYNPLDSLTHDSDFAIRSPELSEFTPIEIHSKKKEYYDDPCIFFILY